MNRLQLVNRVRSMTRDFDGVTFREADVNDYINEAIDRSKQIIQALEGMDYLETNSDVPTHLPLAYHQLLAVYASARCFEQDERHHQSSTLMNEFETKMDELLKHIENERIIIKDENGVVVDGTLHNDYVLDNYYYKNDVQHNPDFDVPADEENDVDGGSL